MTDTDLDREEWREIPGERYSASNLGRIRSHFTGRILKPQKSGRGYHFVNLGGKGKRGVFVHRLVCLAFLGASDLHVNHKNSVKTDNRLENLEYATRRENAQHAKSAGKLRSLWGVHQPIPAPDNRGERNRSAKLTVEVVLDIRRMYRDGELNQVQLGERYGVSNSRISEIINRKTWSHV